MGTQIGGYIFGHEFANLRSILRPIGIVTNDFLATIIGFGFLAFEAGTTGNKAARNIRGV